MNKIAIVENDTEFLNSLCDELCKCENNSIVGTASNGLDALSMIVDKKPNILILNHIMEGLDGFCFLEKMKEMQLDNNPRIFFLTDFPSEDVLNLIKKYDVCYYSIKPIDISSFTSVINKICNENILKITNKKSIEKEIIKIFHDFDIPLHTKGYLYLKDAIQFVYNDQNLMSHLTKHLYPKIAKKHNTTLSRTERAMRHTIELAWKRENNLNFINHFSNNDNKKPSNSKFIAYVCHLIRIKED